MSRINLRTGICWCLAVGVLLTWVGPATAATTGQLMGLVVDDEDAPLPGVTISATAPTQIGGAQLAQTGADGRFQYPNLAPGIFTVRFTLHGFVPQELTEVRIRVDRMTELRVTLPQGTFEDIVEVRESTPVVDPQQISTGQTFSDTYITETAGMFGSWQALIGQAAGTDPEDDRRIMGSVPESNTYLLDNMDATNKWNRGPTPQRSMTKFGTCSPWFVPGTLDSPYPIGCGSTGYCIIGFP